MAERRQRRGRAGTEPSRDPAAEVDAQLARYRSMRDFSATAEPSGAGTRADAAGKLPFVVQKHAATRLHYDFRLGWRGVLKSWAVAKGPSYFTGDRRLAVQVEDHPIEYGGFEGTIPQGQYGGGTVMVWDQGTWEPVGDADEGLAKGSLKFILHGQKLRGHWTLVRMGGRAAQESKPNWLLIKEHDGNERPREAEPVTEAEPDSVITGRSLDQIAAAEDHVWQSHAVSGRRATPAQARQSRVHAKIQERMAKKHAGGAATVPPQSTSESWLEGAPKARVPGFIAPQLATPARVVPPGVHWLHELKLDGYRMQAHLRAGKTGKRAVTLYTRSGLDWTARMPSIAAACAAFPAQSAVLDGEVVALDSEGQPSFGRLQAAFEKGDAATLRYTLFDVLYLDGRDVRGLPLSARKAMLAPRVKVAAQPALVYSEHLDVAAGEVFEHACRVGAEGIVSKQADQPYTSGRGTQWLKLKCTHRQEFVIAGFTLPKDGGSGVGSLLLGYYRSGSLVHCGRCGTGFTQATARAVRRKLEPLRMKTAPYAEPLTAPERKDAIFVHPELVCEVEFAAWTEGGSVRHASFQGLREDKPAQEVVKEEPVSAASVRKAVETNAPSRTAVRRPATGTIAKRKHEPARDSAKAVTGLPRAATIQLTHPDKVLDAASGVTKQQLADYYAAAAPAMLPHLAGRAVSIVRCPGGTGAKCFFQKHGNAGLPDSVGTVLVPDREDAKKTEPYIRVDTAEALTGLAQLSVLELHPWGSIAEHLEQPDRLIFDLDPDESLTWATVADCARSIRDFLKELRLETFVKSTGGKGLHVVAALEPSIEWPQLRLFARGVAAALESASPKLYLIKMTKAARKGRIFLDWMRNERGATAIAPWSPRARAGMRVAAPLAWDELGDGPPPFAVENFNEWRARLSQRANPWAAMRPQRLDPGVLDAVLEHTGDSPRRRRR